MTGSQIFPNGFQGRHMALCLGIFFGTMFVVNGIFLFYAVSTFNGLSTEDAYRKGLHYNNRIAEEDDQKKLGWTSAVAIDQNRQYLSVKISGRENTPVTDLNIKATLKRPATNHFDVQLKFTERSPGKYFAPFEEEKKGNWVLDLRATKPSHAGRDKIYRMRKRLWLTPPK